MAGRLVRLLEAVVAEPERAIGSLDILTRGRARTPSCTPGTTPRARFRPATLPELFAAQVAKHARCGRGGVRGAEPHLRASSMRAPISWRITCATSASARRPWSGCASSARSRCSIGLLGILKAGGAYLPLDPGYPPERLAFMLEDAGAPVLVTHAALLDRLPAHGARIVRLDADWPAIAQQPGAAPGQRRSQPQNPAYVIYTSGSTGTPKGVVVAHGSCANCGSSMQRELRRARRRTTRSADGAARPSTLRPFEMLRSRCSHGGDVGRLSGWPSRHPRRL